ncbi:MAG: ammonium transporter, partial [Parabacteroides distasonis]
MDTKYKGHGFIKLWIATTMFMLCCFATGTLAQDTVIADTATVTETITELSALPAESTAEAPDTIGDLALGLNTVWMLLAAMLVFFMQPGFALVEAGFTRVKNTANILMKNFVDFMFGSLLYWFIGFGLMFGAGGFIGMPHFFDLSFM